MESEYTFDGLKYKLEQNAARTLGVKPIMEIAFEKLDESLQSALVSLSVFPQSFKRDAAEAILGDNCAEALTNLKKRCLIQKQGDRYLIHLFIRGYAKQIGQRDQFRQILVDGKEGYLVVLRKKKKSWRLGNPFIRDPYHTCNATKVARETTDFFFFFSQSSSQLAPYIEDCVPFKLYDDFLNGLLQFSRIQGNKTKQVEILFLLYEESRRHGGDMTELKDLIDQAVELYNNNRHLFEANSLSEAFFFSHLGRYLSQDRGERDKAEDHLQKAFLIVEKEVVNASRFDLGRVLGQMGHNAWPGKAENVKRKKEANKSRDEVVETCFKRALCFRQSHYGKHIVTALAHKDLASIYMSTEEFGKAEKHYKEAVGMFEDMGVMKQKVSIPTYKNFGRCYVRSRKYELAREKFEMGSKVAENTIEGNHKWKVEINTNLALILYKYYPDEVRKAKELAKNVFSMAKELKMENWFHREELVRTFYQKG
ncbi:unnamed protein product [Porites lobata]|uniref:Tetratricopeptide repeat protein n=1 Tax=Porites lobata TaxID=104759 RepID=A0ABN8RLG2_9CNID|nr:unnamed protein product [Porites lobata]